MNPDNTATGTLSLRDYIDAAARRRVSMAIALGIGLLGTLLLAFLLPARYQSTGTILIEQQELPTELVRSAISSYADQRIQVISQRVMTTQNLLQIVQRYDLYADKRDSETREEIVERMRSDVAFRMISADVIDPRSGMPREATIAFAVSYTSRSPDLAVKVANEVTTLYLNENLTSRTRLAEEASGFLQSESDRLSRRIAELEVKLAAFKEKHVNSLPELSQLNLQLLDRTETELRMAESERNSLEQQRVFLEAQLLQIKPNSMLMTETGERIMSPDDRLKVLRSQLASATALYGTDHPDIARLQREISGLESQADDPADRSEVERRLADKIGELAAARQRYTEDHPDVRRLQREVDALGVTLAAPAAAPRARPRPSTPDNPAYIQLRAQLSATNNDHAALLQRIAGLRAQVGDYESRIRNSPQIEREYQELSRDYANSQAKYQELRAKSLEAQVSQNLESDRKGERFTLIEPPLPPTKPISPNRKAILFIGLFLSLGLAVLVAALRESLDATVRGRKDLQQLLDLSPMALIPRIISDEERASFRRRMRIGMGSAAAGVVLTLVALHLLVRPLDLLLLSGLRRFGL